AGETELSVTVVLADVRQGSHESHPERNRIIFSIIKTGVMQYGILFRIALSVNTETSSFSLRWIVFYK
ncbi:hypothetical protein, partial [Salmonella enterica]|uniref:hypothetical protein n=1 Tax=Salmonella enterica TaxID=28901 RepID=UPI001CC03F09